MMKVIIVKEVMTCDVSSVAMFPHYQAFRPQMSHPFDMIYDVFQLDFKFMQQ